MQGKLFVVGTPIGNLGDLSHRAKEILSAVDYIACEDSRRSSVLLGHYGIKKPFITYHKFCEKKTTSKILSLMSQNKDIALISDAGMPCLSDPGAILIQAAREGNFLVESVPGPTALTTAYSLSGINFEEFIFLGFLPEKNIKRMNIIREFKNASIPIVLYCAPHDLSATTQFLKEELGDRELVVARELTKKFEEVIKTKLSEMPTESLKGEIVLIILPQINVVSRSIICQSIKNELKKGRKKSEVVKIVASNLEISKNSVYDVMNEMHNGEEI